MVLPWTGFVEHVRVSTDYFYHQRLIYDVVNYLPLHIIVLMVSRVNIVMILSSDFLFF